MVSPSMGRAGCRKLAPSPTVVSISTLLPSMRRAGCQKLAPSPTVVLISTLSPSMGGGGGKSADCSPRRDDAVALRRLDVDSIDDYVAIAAIDSGVQWCPSSCVQGKLLEIASSLVSSSSQQ